jgi:P-type Cu2+ transporter
LHKLGYTLELLSGDRKPIVEATARACGITQWQGEVRPDAKAHHVESLKSHGRRVLMVGDGLNDAPALAAGHASVAPSTATDVSQTASDVIFQGAKLGPLIEILAVSKAAHRSAIANFAIAIGYNVLFVPLAMLGFVTPLIAAIAMSVSSITVTANAVWLGHKRLKDMA